ncbi:SET domain-containing protein-lysine N-methyltransferase [Kribbella sp. NPDC026611]|uniref:SET domain-containing protein-lysine N-methyltransferase n=1 Tax=Kribbella sp. NPDC026611 TaxID=3154911 RepID=UPI0034026D3D
MLHPAASPGISDVNGVGIFAVASLPRGTIVWRRCDNCVELSRVDLTLYPDAVSRWYDEFGIGLDHGAVLVPCGGAHLFNHSCSSSAVCVNEEFGCLSRDVVAGEEITCNYLDFSFEKPWSFTCSCGAASCVSSISARGSDTPPPWMKTVEPDVFRSDIARVLQPLGGGGRLLDLLLP